MERVHSEFVDSLHLADCRLINYPAKIFVCGGKVNDASTAPISVRDRFLRFVAQHRPKLRDQLVKAEDVFKWFSEDHYQDLVELERDMAGLSELILVFVESPGSFTELGTFVLLDQLERRLVAISDVEFEGDDSFIEMGPLRLLKRRDGDEAVHYFPMAPVGEDEVWSDVATRVATLLEARLESAPKERRVSLDIPGHVMMLISDFVEMATAVRFKEFQSFLESLHCTISDGKLHQYLYLLGQLQIVSRYVYSSDVFYFPSLGISRLKHAYTESATMRDRQRWKVLMLEEYEKQRESDSRFAAIRAYRTRRPS